MTSIALVQKLTFDYTRKVQRKTMLDYYKAVRVGRNTKPVWSCIHKHETRMEAFVCFLDLNPRFFGKTTDGILGVLSIIKR
jgi:hypothetical protein